VIKDDGVGHGRVKKIKAGFGWVNVKENNHLKGLEEEGKIIIIKCVLKKQGERVWIGLPGRGVVQVAGSLHLVMKFGFHKMQGFP